MSKTFYRVHMAPLPFSADNAWSGTWGSEFNADGSQYHCPCDGHLFGPAGDPDADCRDCGGDGWVGCDRGYSSCWTAQELIGYFTDPARCAPTGDTPVIVFSGERTGTGCDGEPLAVPDRIVATYTWAGFVAKHGSTA